MADEAACPDPEIVRIIKSEVRHSWVGRRKIAVPKYVPAFFKMFLLRRSDDGHPQLSPLNDKEEVECECGRNIDFVFVQVDTNHHPVDLEFHAVAKDEFGYSHDLVLECSFIVCGLETFICDVAVAHAHASLERPMTLRKAKEWIERAIRTEVREHIQGQLDRFTFEEIRDKEVMESAWWQKKLNDWLDSKGVRIRVETAQWPSAAATREEQEQARNRELEEGRKSKKRDRDVELQEVLETAEHERKKQEIQHQRDLDAKRLKHEEEVAEYLHQIEMEKLRAKQAELRAEQEARELESQAALARISQGEEQARKFEELRRELIEKSNKELLQAKLELAEQMGRRLANSDMLTILSEDAGGPPASDPESSAALLGQRDRTRGAEPPLTKQEEAKGAVRQEGRKDKVRALAEQRAKASAEGARNLMTRLGQVFEDAARAEDALKETEDSEQDKHGRPTQGRSKGRTDSSPPASTFDFDRMSKLFISAATKERGKATSAGGKGPVMAAGKESDKGKGLQERFRDVYGRQKDATPRQEKVEVKFRPPIGSGKPPGTTHRPETAQGQDVAAPVAGGESVKEGLCRKPGKTLPEVGGPKPQGPASPPAATAAGKEPDNGKGLKEVLEGLYLRGRKGEDATPREKNVKVDFRSLAFAGKPPDTVDRPVAAEGQNAVVAPMAAAEPFKEDPPREAGKTLPEVFAAAIGKAMARKDGPAAGAGEASPESDSKKATSVSSESPTVPLASSGADKTSGAAKGGLAAFVAAMQTVGKGQDAKQRQFEQEKADILPEPAQEQGKGKTGKSPSASGKAAPAPRVARSGLEAFAARMQALGETKGPEAPKSRKTDTAKAASDSKKKPKRRK